MQPLGEVGTSPSHSLAIWRSSGMPTGKPGEARGLSAGDALESPRQYPHRRT